ncbi:MAG: 3-phosphoserine/phosphohydroxythreonine transaminase [Planctomycetota bacterium]
MTTIDTTYKTARGRAFNFSAGPAVLPEPVIEQAQKDLMDVFGSGMGVCELSHRGAQFDRILEEAEADLRAVGKIPGNYRVLFLQGGATLQTAMIPMSFLPEGKTADYFDTGKWASEAIKEAKKIGGVNIAGSTKDTDYDRLPDFASANYTDGAAYRFFVSNNTIFGTQFADLPKSDAPIVCDMSSDIFCRPIEWAKYDFVYASLQKNLGPSGQALVVIKDDFLATAPDDTLPKMLDYKVQAAKESRYNTPNTFAIYLLGQVVKWVQTEFGSLEAVEAYNKEKAAVLYDYLDAQSFYVAHVKDPAHRSLMNITFRCPKPEQDKAFIEQAEKCGLTTIGGHRSIGGMRASIYNAMPIEGLRALVEFMQRFADEHA